MRDLGEMSPNKFTNLCQLYEVGAPERPCGTRAIELSPGFIEELLDRPGGTPALPVANDDAAPHARTRENSGISSTENGT
jgi:hypothetical protein